MRLGQIQDVDVVADAGTVRRGIVRAQNRDLGCSAGGHVHHNWDEVLHEARVFPIAGIERGACGIEVAQRRCPHTVAGIKPAQHLFDHELALAVGVFRTQGRVLVHGQGLGRAIHCRA